MVEKKNKPQFGIDGTFLKKFDWELASKRVMINQKADFLHAPHIRILFQKKFDDLRESLDFELKNGRYVPDPPITIDVPKSNRMLVRPTGRRGPSFSRPGSILMPKERLLYQILADFAEPVVRKRLDRSRAYSHWLPRRRTAEMFLPSRETWGSMQRRFSELSSDRSIKYVLKLDIANCFSSINLHTLVKFLEKSGYPPELVGSLENLLIRFTGTRSSRGIIQGVFPSDLFGNFYLTPIDECLADWSVPSVRYVDDFFLFVESREAAHHLLRRITEEFRRYDLTLNESKSYLMRTSELANDEPDLDALFDNALSEAKLQFANSEVETDYGFQAEWEFEEDEESEDNPEVELRATEELFSSISTFNNNEEKIERFCIPVFMKARSDFAVEYVLANFLQQPHMTQIYCSYLITLKTSEIRIKMEEFFFSNRLYFDWQKMWVLASLVQFEAGSDEIARACLDLVRNSQYHDGLRAVAAIYVAKHGSYTRQHALISLHDSAGSKYVQAAIMYAARFFGKADRNNAKMNWAGRSYLHTLLAGCI